MADKILIRDGRLVNPASGTDAALDVLIENGIVSRIEEAISVSGAREIDARGLVVAPGFVDMHTHLREPGGEAKETIESGSRSGVKGGFCALAPMANTDPPVDDPDTVRFVKTRASKSAWTHIYPIAAVTRGLKGETLTDAGQLREAGAVALSDDGRPVLSSRLFREALERAKAFDIPVISHCEDTDLTRGGCMNEGMVSATLGYAGMPAEAEKSMVERDIELARQTGARLHIAHVSCARSVALVRDAKRDGVNVTAETAPHYFSLTEEAVKTCGTNAKMNPPLRTAKDVEAIKEGLRDGTIDAIATDHAPHAKAEKNAPFPEAPFGIIGLETCLSLVMTKLVGEGVLSLSEAIVKLALAPARILGLPMGELKLGARADITIFDPERELVVDSRLFESKSRNTPFEGWRLRGQAIHVIVGGVLRLHNGMFIGVRPDI